MFARRLCEYGKFLKSLLKTNFRLFRGMWNLTRLPQPAVTVFGGSKVNLDSEIAEKAKNLTKILANNGFSIITGGGPGIMEAANLGAIEHLKECHANKIFCKDYVISGGVGLIRLNKERANPYVQEYVEMDHFFSRKWLLVRYSIGFVVFPGGFGTLDELFEVITLVQCHRMARVPIVLMGKNYWAPLLDWLITRAIPLGLVKDSDEKIITTVTDDVDEAAYIITSYCKEKVKSVFHNGASPKE
jgi:uncharacterized protein (TIGR00730 family)